MKPKKGGGYPQELLDLPLDKRVHGDIGRRDFLYRVKMFASGGMTATALWASLHSNYAWAQVQSTGSASSGADAAVATKIKYYIAKNDWDSIVKMGNVAVPQLIAALSDENFGIRWGAAETLGRIGDERAIRPLIVALQKDDDADSAVGALFKLGFAPQIDDPSMRMRFGISPKPASISPDLDDSVLLWTKYRRSGEWEEQIVAMGKTAVDPLCKILQQAKQHGHQETMRRAVRPLGAIGDARAVDSLLAVADLSDQTDSGYINVADDYPVTTAAADALGMIGDERAVPKLLKLLGSEGSTRRTGDVWAACCRALARIGDDRAVSAIGSLLQRQLSTRHQYDVWWEDDAVKALASFGRKSVKPLTAVLKTQPAGLNDTERSRRLTATCVALGDIGDKEAVTALSETLHDRDTGVKIAAINALGKLKDPRAVDALVSMLNDPDRTVREAAANALDALGWKP